MLDLERVSEFSSCQIIENENENKKTKVDGWALLQNQHRVLPIKHVLGHLQLRETIPGETEQKTTTNPCHGG